MFSRRQKPARSRMARHCQLWGRETSCAFLLTILRRASRTPLPAIHAVRAPFTNTFIRGRANRELALYWAIRGAEQCDASLQEETILLLSSSRDVDARGMIPIFREAWGGRCRAE